MSISLIAAIGKNNEIGKKNQLLWNLPVDMKHFKDTTAGKTVIMGQKTFESLGRPLPNRQNVVLTQDKNFKNENLLIFYSLDELNNWLDLPLNKEKENFIIGGGQVYRLFIDKADKLYITHVDASFPDADTYFPEIISIVWNEVSHKEHKKDKEHAYDLVFSVYERMF